MSEAFKTPLLAGTMADAESDSQMATPVSSADSALSAKAQAAELSGLVLPSGPPDAVQCHGAGPSDIGSAHHLAALGTSGTKQQLPHIDRIQSAFGPGFDLSQVGAHVGGMASQACDDLGADAYAAGSSVAFKGAPSLRLAAHEAAHVVQQQKGAKPRDGVGRAGDSLEQHADAVADRVAAGDSAADLLSGLQGGNSGQAAVQMNDCSSCHPGLGDKKKKAGGMSPAMRKMIRDHLSKPPPAKLGDGKKSDKPVPGCPSSKKVQDDAKKYTYLHQFKMKMKQLALNSLNSSKAQISAERGKLARSNPSVKGPQLLKIAKEIHRLNTKIHGYDIKKKPLRYSDKPCKAGQKINALDKKTKQAQVQKKLWESQYPLFSRLTPGELKTCLSKGGDKAQLTALYGAASAAALKIIGDVEKTKKNINDGSLDLWELPSIVAATTQVNQITDAEKLGWIRDKIATNSARKAILNIAAIALQMGLLAVSGGLSGLAMLGVRALALGIGVLDAHMATTSYFAKIAATNTNMNKHKSLLDPAKLGGQGVWLALAWIGVGLDVVDVVRAIRALKAGKTAKQVAAASGGKISEDLAEEGKRFIDGSSTGAVKPKPGKFKKGADWKAQGAHPLNNTTDLSKIITKGNEHFIVGTPLASEAAGHVVMKRLASGDPTALTEVGIRGASGFDPRTFEWGLGLTKDGKYVLIKGSETSVVWHRPAKGIKALAHSHPYKAEWALKPVGGKWTIADVIKDDDNLARLFPSGSDVKQCHQLKEIPHSVHTPYVYNPANGTIGNPVGSGGTTITFEIKAIKNVEVPDKIAELVATVEAKAGGVVIWSGKTYTPTLFGGLKLSTIN